MPDRVSQVGNVTKAELEDGEVSHIVLTPDTLEIIPGEKTPLMNITFNVKESMLRDMILHILDTEGHEVLEPKPGKENTVTVSADSIEGAYTIIESLQNRELLKIAPHILIDLLAKGIQKSDIPYMQDEQARRKFGVSEARENARNGPMEGEDKFFMALSSGCEPLPPEVRVLINERLAQLGAKARTVGGRYAG